MENEFLKFFFGYVEGKARTKAILAIEICAKIEQMIENQPCPVVSLDRIYAPRTDYTIEATRVTDPVTKESTIGPRQNCPSIYDQIGFIDTRGPIAVADCGAFDGGTIEKICEMLEKRSIAIDCVYLGVCGRRAKERLSARWNLKCAYTMELYEWIELRDAFLIDGRAACAPDRKRWFIPYSENLQNWASIPSGREEEAAKLCGNIQQKAYRAAVRDQSDRPDTGEHRPEN